MSWSDTYPPAVKGPHVGLWTYFRADTIFVKINETRPDDFLDNFIAQLLA